MVTAQLVETINRSASPPRVRPFATYQCDRTNLLLVGLGGTGSHLSERLAQLVWQRNQIGKQTALSFVDHDRVERSNVLARQRFCPADSGKSKASVLAFRCGRPFGLDIPAVTSKFSPEMVRVNYDTLTILIGCVDSREGRRAMHAALEVNERFDLPRVFWLDGGNHDSEGQCCIGSSNSVDGPKGAGLAAAFDEHFCYKAPSPGLLLPDLLEERPEEEGGGAHACTARVNANRQSPTINFRMAAEIDTFLQLFLLGRLTRFLTYLSSDQGSSATYENTPEQFSARLAQEPGFFVSPSNLYVRTGGTTPTPVVR